MNFFYRNTQLPKNSDLLKQINNAAMRLHNKLKQLDINSLRISDYNKRYLINYRKNITSILHKYCYIFAWSIVDTSIALDQFVFIDYGGGSGILSLLAKEYGINTVVYNDIYETSCSDARIIALTLGNEADYYVHGDIDTVIDLVKTKSLRSTALASYDVIEHIYNLEAFLTNLKDVSPLPFTAVMASGANPLNPVKKRRFMRYHMNREYKNQEKKWGHKERDCLKSYFDVRREIISSHVPTLLDAEKYQLAMSTRGLIESEIKECVEEYLRSGKVLRRPDHPTNTCDPYTGNWAERLIDIDHVRKILLDAGFEVSVISGYYGGSNSILKRLVGYILNTLIAIHKDNGLIFAPFFVIRAKKTYRS